MYNPLQGSALEFIELRNVGDETVAMSGFSFSGVDYSFPIGASLSPGGFLVLTSNENPTAFATAYPGVSVFGRFSGRLRNEGELVALMNGQGRLVVTVDFNDKGGWPEEADGDGFSLELIDPDGDPDDPANWQASVLLGGTPGAPRSLPSPSSVLLNEVMAFNQSAVRNGVAFPEWIELSNQSDVAVDLTGWSLSDDGGNRLAYVFPVGVSIPAAGELVVWADDRLADPGLHAGFDLNESGETVFLFDRLGRRVDALSYGAQAADFSIGRMDLGIWQLTLPTPGEPNQAAELAAPNQLKINEWLSNPGSGEEDWLEIYNRDPDHPVALRGLHVANDNVAFRIGALAIIEPNGHLRLWADELTGVNHLDIKLPARGDQIVLTDSLGEVLDFLQYPAQVERLSSGRLPDGSDAIVVFTAFNTPGRSNFIPVTEVVISEFLAHTDPPFEDAIELHNPGLQPVDLSGWYLSDDIDQLKKFQFPEGSILAPAAFAMLYEIDLSPVPDVFPSFTLDGTHGETIFLSAIGESGELNGRRIEVPFDASANKVSFGRYETSAGVDYVPFKETTFGIDEPVNLVDFRLGQGEANAEPVIGPAVINEIMYLYHDDAFPVPNEDIEAEYIEIHNPTEAAVSLFDPAFPNNTWRLRGGIAFDFPAGIVISPGESLLVVNFNPATDDLERLRFFQTYQLQQDTALFGPYAGRLSNRGETVELQRPDPPETHAPDAGFVPYLLVEKVEYRSELPWPTAAALGRQSLQKKQPLLYSNEAFNWVGATPTPAAPNTGLTPPDRDQDGLPDEWESEFGFNPDFAADAHQDGDLDSATNLDEFFAGTHPFNNAIVFALNAALNPGAFSVVSFTAQAGRRYQVQYREDINGAAWHKLADLAPKTFARNVSVADSTAGQGRRFYRGVVFYVP